MKIRIPPGATVFVLEDNKGRQGWFRRRIPHAVMAATSEGAIKLLDAQKFDFIFLDQDLGFLDAADPYRLHYNGKEVARYLARKQFSGTIVIHNVNHIGAKYMKETLPKAIRAPFGRFDIN